jgi:hypothetical protein
MPKTSETWLVVPMANDDSDCWLSTESCSWLRCIARRSNAKRTTVYRRGCISSEHYVQYIYYLIPHIIIYYHVFICVALC